MPRPLKPETRKTAVGVLRLTGSTFGVRPRGPVGLVTSEASSGRRRPASSGG